MKAAKEKVCGKKKPEETETQPILAMENADMTDDENDIVSMRDKDTESIKTEADNLSVKSEKADDAKSSKDTDDEEDDKKDDDREDSDNDDNEATHPY